MTDWSSTFFSGLWLEVHDKLWSAERTRDDARLCVDLLGLAEGQRVLDAPCGNGRMSVELARAGLRVTGVDWTPSLLGAARQRAQKAGVELELHERDMVNLQELGPFHGAVCWWGSLGYRSDADDQRFFTAVGERLVRGGRFVLDNHVTESLLPKFEPRGWHRAEDVLVLEEREWDHHTGRVEVNWILTKEGVHESKHTSIRIYSFAELEAMLNEAGLSVVHAYGSTELEPFEVGASRLVLVVEKQTTLE